MEKVRENYKLRFIGALFFIVILGFILLLIGQSEKIASEFWKSVFSNVALALFISGILGLINEYILKDSLIEIILSKINLKQSIDRTGIEHVYTNIKEVDYDYYFSKSKSKIDIVHVYGQTWTNTHLDEIKSRLLNSNCKIRVVLLSPNSEFIPALAKDYNMSPDELRQKIYDVTDLWKELAKCKVKTSRKKTQSNLELYYSSGKPFFSLYRIDDRVIQISTRISTGKSKALPVIICKNTFKADDLYDLYVEEIQLVINQSEKQILI